MGPARYTHLASALPGVASNLLADRMRGLVLAGVVERGLAPGSNSVVYALTLWGAQLRETVDCPRPLEHTTHRSGRGDDTFRGTWLATALRALLGDRTSATPVAVGLDTAGTVMTVQLDGTGARVVLDPDPPPSTVLRADPEVVLALAARTVNVDRAIARGNLQGDPQELAAVFGAADSGNARRPPLPT